ncbi:MAG: IS630 family transposase, partial [Nitrospirales bacterium]
KSQIQALDRTQPGVPLKPGRCGTMTHDDNRHGTTTLFAALNVAEGSLLSTCWPRHRHQEWLRFLRLIDRQVPPGTALHLIADTYATHQHPTVQRWLTRHPRVHRHFTPTRSSWLHLVERVLGDLTAKQIRRGVFRSVPELIAAIDTSITQRKAQPKPLVWTKTAQEILAKVNRARLALDKTRTA